MLPGLGQSGPVLADEKIVQQGVVQPLVLVQQCQALGYLNLQGLDSGIVTLHPDCDMDDVPSVILRTLKPEPPCSKDILGLAQRNFLVLFIHVRERFG